MVMKQAALISSIAVASLMVLALPADSSPNDVDGDGRVDNADCIRIIAAWGSDDAAAVGAELRVVDRTGVAYEHDIREKSGR